MKIQISCYYLFDIANPHFPVLAEFKSVYAAFEAINYFPPYNPFLHRCKVASLSLLYRYFYSKYSDTLYFLVSQVQAFTAKTSPATYTETIYHHALPIPLVRR